MCDVYIDDDDRTYSTQTSEITFDSVMTDDITIDEITVDSFDLYHSQKPSRKMMRAKRMSISVPQIQEDKASNDDDVKMIHISQCENFRNILIGFYEVCKPEKLANIQRLLKMFHDDETKLLQLMKRVEGEYNVSLIPPSHAVTSNAYDVKGTRKEEKMPRRFSTIQEEEVKARRCSTSSTGSSDSFRTQNTNPSTSSEQDSYEKICYQPKMKLKKPSGNKNRFGKYMGTMKNIMDKVENASTSANSFLDNQSKKYEKYLLNKDYKEKKKHVSSE